MAGFYTSGGQPAAPRSYNGRVAFRAVIFDFDGLIIESEAPLFEIWAAIYRDHGGRLTLDHWRHALGTHDGFDPYAELERQTGVCLPGERWTAHVRDEHVRRCGQIPVLPGVRARLDEARRLGLPAAVASSSSLEWVGRWLDVHGLRSCFDALSTRDRVERVKPAPDLLLLAAADLGVAPADCVVFDDTPNGIAAAHAAGMWAVAVPTAMTCRLDFPAPHLTLASLEARTLEQLREDLVAAGASPAGRDDPEYRE